tara:strand:- start:1772 stop:2389 length:618 start_codon:yes stop_codon:yes gene_type:complete
MSELQVNTINENSSGSGVTIDGALIKDNFLVATAGGGMVKLAEYTFSDDADKDFDVCDGTKYYGYKIILKDFHPATDDASARLAFRNDGSDVLTSLYTHRAAYTMATNSSGSLAGSASNPSGYFELTFATGTASGEYGHAIAELFPHDTEKTWVSRSIREQGNGTKYISNKISFAKDNTTVDGIRIYASSGNITSGNIAIWGYVK